MTHSRYSMAEMNDDNDEVIKQGEYDESEVYATMAMWWKNIYRQTVKFYLRLLKKYKL